MSHPRSLSACILGLCCLAVLYGCSGGSPAVDDEDKDTTPPQPVMDLFVSHVTSQSATLQWTTPHDRRDDGSVGAVVGYDVRTANATITEDNFAQARALDSVPAPLPFGQLHTLLVTNLAPGATHYFAMKSRDDKGNWSGISASPSAVCPPIKVVSFPDPGLELAIRNHVHKPAGDLLSADVDTIRYLSAAGKGIVNPTGLTACLTLEAVELGGNRIADLTPLHDVYWLRGLYLDSNQVSDLSPLINMTGLLQLHLMGNPITDIGPIAHLLSLQQLTLSGEEIADFSPLSRVETLTDLYLGIMNLENIDFVASLDRLRILNVQINHISSVEPLRGLTALEALVLLQNQIADIAPLAGLTNLRDLNLAANRITDLQPLVSNSGLGSGDRLDVSQNPLSAQALNVQIPVLEARGVVVQH